MKEKMHLKKKDWVLIAIIIVVAGLAFFLHNLLLIPKTEFSVAYQSEKVTRFR